LTAPTPRHRAEDRRKAWQVPSRHSRNPCHTGRDLRRRRYDPQFVQRRIDHAADPWDHVKKSASDAIDAIGKGASGHATTAERLAVAEAQRRAAEYGFFGRRDDKGVARADNRIADLRNKSVIEQIQQENRVAQERRNRSSLEAQSITDKFFPDNAARRDLETSISKLEEVINDPGADKMADSFKKAESALRQMRENAAAVLDPVQRIALATDIAVKSIMARTVQERVTVELMQQQLQLSQAGAKTDEVRAETAKRIAEIMAQANREARDALRAANDNLSLAGLRPYQRGLQEIEIRRRENAVRFGGGTSSSGGLRDSNIPVRGGMSLDAALDLIEKLESGGRNIPNYKFGPGFTAQGYFQFTNSTWRDTAKAAGIDLTQYPNAMSAPYDVQRRAAATLYQQRGFQPWEALKNHPAATGASGSAGNIADIEKRTLAINTFDTALRSSNDALRDQIEKLELEAQKGTQTSYEIGKAAKSQELINKFRQEGLPLSDAMRAKIEAEADAYGRLNERATSLRFVRDVAFERQQLGRSQGEQAIASRLRDSGVGMDSQVADAMRLNQIFGDIRETATGALTGFISDLRRGKSAAEALRNVMDRIADKLLNKAADSLIASFLSTRTSTGGGGLFGSLFGGLFGGGGPLFGFADPLVRSANGNAFGSHGIVPFANGGVVTRPTIFPFANGIGLMGEAGEEAIMPLRRNGRGQLGVHVAGNDNRTGGLGGVVVYSTFAPVISAAGADKAELAAMRRDLDRMAREQDKRAVAGVLTHQKRAV